MASDEYTRLKDAVADALDLPPGDRHAFLDDALGADSELRERAGRLLAQQAQLGEFLDKPCAPPLDPEAADLAVGARVAGYEVVRRIAAGGAGTVYEAVQDSPRRSVALKLLHAIRGSGMARRFERESLLLAQLQHPGIAHVYEAGVHGEGLESIPFIAMELVPDARTIVDHAEVGGLDLPARLELFVEVCRAVQHGHDRGVVHRDLKPANVLVGADGRPKVIDFGIARVLQDDSVPRDGGAPATIHTEVGDLVGTLPYMSPEQCGVDPASVDARADVYALGVVLFELLTGRLPLGVVGLPVDEAVRTIRWGTPSRLCRVAPQLPRDLEAVTAKALEKDPADRYASVADLAADVQRVLDERPVAARPPSLVRDARLFARRHRTLVAVVGACVVALLTATVLSSYFAFRAERAAEAESHQRRVAELSNVYLQDLLRAPSPHAGGREVTVLELLDTMATRLAVEPVELPEVEVAVRAAIGETYLHLGRTASALEQLSRAATLCREVDPHGQTLVDVLVQLALARGQNGEAAEAEALYREVLGFREATGADPREIALLMGNVTDQLLARGELDEALRMGRATLERLRGADDVSGEQLAGNLRRLARILELRGEHVEAAALLREALRKASVTDDHPLVAATLVELAKECRAMGAGAEAREQLARAWDLVVRHRPAGSRDWNITLMAYLSVLDEQGAADAALALLRSAVRLLEDELGSDDYRVREARALLAAREARRPERAVDDE